MTKRILTAITALACLLALTGCAPEGKQPEESTPAVESTLPAPEHDHAVSNGKPWKEWTATDSLPGTQDGAFNYYLSADVVLTKGQTLTEGTDMELCLNGHTVTAPQQGTIYNLCNAVRTVVCDCTRSAVIKPGPMGSAFQLNGDVSLLVLQDVTIDGAGVTGDQTEYGPVHINGFGANVTLDGATIKNCTAVNGAAIYAHGKASRSAVVNITNGSVITGNKVLPSTEGSAAVLGKLASIHVSDSFVTDNVSDAICGVAISFATSGSLNLHNATITGNHSNYANADAQVGAIYIHNGNRNVTLSGDTVIADNTRHDGGVADLYLQRTVRETDPSRWPNPLRMQLGTLTENAHINICPGTGYTLDQFKGDLNEIPLLSFTMDAQNDTWNNRWLTVSEQNEFICYDPVSQTFVTVPDTVG